MTKPARSALLRWCLAGATAALLVLAAGAGSPARANVAVNVSFFYSDLAPYGQWVDEPGYGWCWSPYSVAATWRPYEDGYWAYTDQGWAWASYEPWGWATYHYGRWFYDPDLGWMWLPGDEWAPAWVAWRWDDDDDWVGWAPLPPDASWSGWYGVREIDVDRLPVQSWCFAPAEAIVQPGLPRYVYSSARNPLFLRHSTVAPWIVSRGGRPFVQGVSVATLERRTGRPVPRMRIADLRSAPRGAGQVRQTGALGFFRPAVRMQRNIAPPRNAIASREQAVRMQGGRGGRAMMTGRGRMERAPMAMERGPMRMERAPQERGPMRVERAPRQAERMPMRAERAPQAMERGRMERAPQMAGRAPRMERGPRMERRAPVERAPRYEPQAPARHESPRAERAPARSEPAPRAEAYRGRGPEIRAERAPAPPARQPGERGRGHKDRHG